KTEFQTSDGPWRQPDGTFDSLGPWLIWTDVLPTPERDLILTAVRDEFKWRRLGNYLYTLGQVPLPHAVNDSVVLCDGPFGVAQAGGRRRPASAVESIVVSRGDVRVGGSGVLGMVVLAGGDVYLAESGTFDNSTILARGKVHWPKWPKRDDFKNCRIESDVK